MIPKGDPLAPAHPFIHSLTHHPLLGSSTPLRVTPTPRFRLTKKTTLVFARNQVSYHCRLSLSSNRDCARQIARVQRTLALLVMGGKASTFLYRVTLVKRSRAQVNSKRVNLFRRGAVGGGIASAFSRRGTYSSSGSLETDRRQLVGSIWANCLCGPSVGSGTVHYMDPPVRPCRSRPVPSPRRVTVQTE